MYTFGTCHKEQKLGERKVWRVTRFYAENLCGFYFICIENAAIAQSICRKNFFKNP